MSSQPPQPPATPPGNEPSRAERRSFVTGGNAAAFELLGQILHEVRVLGGCVQALTTQTAIAAADLNSRTRESERRVDLLVKQVEALTSLVHGANELIDSIKNRLG